MSLPAGRISAAELQVAVLAEHVTLHASRGSERFEYRGKTVTQATLAKEMAELQKPVRIALAENQGDLRVEAVALNPDEVALDHSRVSSFWSPDGIGRHLKFELGLTDDDVIPVKVGARHFLINLGDLASWWRDYQSLPGLVLGLHEIDGATGPGGVEVRISMADMIQLKWLARRRR